MRVESYWCKVNIINWRTTLICNWERKITILKNWINSFKSWELRSKNMPRSWPNLMNSWMSKTTRNGSAKLISLLMKKTLYRSNLMNISKSSKNKAKTHYRYQIYSNKSPNSSISYRRNLTTFKQISPSIKALSVMEGSPSQS